MNINQQRGGSAILGGRLAVGGHTDGTEYSRGNNVNLNKNNVQQNRMIVSVPVDPVNEGDVIKQNKGIDMVVEFKSCANPLFTGIEK